MDIIVKGIVKQILPLQKGTSQSGKEWVKQEYLLEHDQGQYPRSICFGVFGLDKINSFNIQYGEVLTVHLNIEAREHNGRWFNSIDAWKVDREQATQPQPAQAPTAPQPAQPQPAPQPKQDDLPF